MVCHGVKYAYFCKNGEFMKRKLSHIVPVFDLLSKTTAMSVK